VRDRPIVEINHVDDPDAAERTEVEGLAAGGWIERCSVERCRRS
jgi:hypothetical protein